MDNFIFDDLRKSAKRTDDYNVLVQNMRRHHFFMFQLTQTMRQQDCRVSQQTSGR